MAEVTPNGPGLVAPTYFPPRDFRTAGSEESGNIVNPPTYAGMGGLTGPSKVDNSGFTIEKTRPGSAPTTRKASRV